MRKSINAFTDICLSHTLLFWSSAALNMCLDKGITKTMYCHQHNEVEYLVHTLPLVSGHSVYNLVCVCLLCPLGML